MGLYGNEYVLKSNNHCVFIELVNHRNLNAITLDPNKFRE